MEHFKHFNKVIQSIKNKEKLENAKFKRQITQMEPNMDP